MSSYGQHGNTGGIDRLKLRLAVLGVLVLSKLGLERRSPLSIPEHAAAGGFPCDSARPVATVIDPTTAERSAA